MPRKHGLRDDDLLGRLADLETRMDLQEGAPKDARMAVPERDERRDTDPRNRQVMVTEGDRVEQPNPPDSFAGEAQDDNVRIVDANVRDRGEASARAKAKADEGKPEEKPKAKADEKKPEPEAKPLFGKPVSKE